MKYKRLSEYKVEKIMKCFCEDLTASTTARILSINRNTINTYFNEFRQRILGYSIKNNKEVLADSKLMKVISKRGDTRKKRKRSC